MRIAFRVDASNKIGTGHLMRCLTLGEALRDKGARVVFVCRDQSRYLCDLVEEKGFEVVRLAISVEEESLLQDEPTSLAHAPWLGTSQSVDAKKTIQALKNDAPWDWLIVDHYALDYHWESHLRPVADKIMGIDDLADRKHVCNLLLDQNYFREPEKRYKGLLSEHCDTLLGPKYALLRPEFREARKFCHMRGGCVARVLIYFGGNDLDNLTGMALEAMSDKNLSHLLVDAVIGPNNPHQSILEKQAQQRPKTRLHIQPEAFTELMLRADLCIGAGGTTTWERLCLGLPSLVITVAENQEYVTSDLDRAGLVYWIGRKGEVTVSDISDSIVEEINKFKKQDINYNYPSPVDGLGSLRVLEKLYPSQNKELTLRKATPKDMELFYFWANDPTLRANSFQQKPIQWENHIFWFTKKIRSTETEMWVMQTFHGLPLGQIRFDKDDAGINISYSLDPIARGRGLGTKLLELGINKISEKNPDAVIQGQVKKSNTASRKTFIKLGFNETIEKDVSTFTKKIS